LQNKAGLRERPFTGIHGSVYRIHRRG
jgi:hypothetical protein